MNLNVLVAAAALTLCVAGAAFATEITGKVTHVRDADTIEVRGVPIQFDGVDAPELHEPGGAEGKVWMNQNYAGRTVRCVLNRLRTGAVRPFRTGLSFP